MIEEEPLPASKRKHRAAKGRAQTARVEPAGDLVEQYLRRLSPVRTTNSEAAFLQQLANKYGRDKALALRGMVDHRTGGDLSDDFYGFKNQDLQFSIDVSLGYSRDLYKRLMTWLLDGLMAGDLPAPRRVLDLGCEQGLITCLLACSFPEAQVIGLDISGPAIERAQELADRLQLQNVAFRRHDLAAGIPADGGDATAGDDATAADAATGADPAAGPDSAYSLVLDARVLTGSGLLGLPDVDARVWSLAELEPVVSSPLVPAVLKDIARALDTDGGAFVRADWLGSYESLLRLTRAFEAAGLTLDWPNCSLLSVNDLGVEKSLPVLVARKRLEQVVSPPYELLALVAHPELVRLSKQVTFAGPAAELIFDAFSDKVFIEGFELVYSDGSGRSRRELWQAGGLVLSYYRTTRWFRQLSLHSAGQLHELSEALARAAEEDRQSGVGRVEAIVVPGTTGASTTDGGTIT
jgi:SAM-dependent methyltransferase